jgi:tRNA nucleotidyltransferase (CCA-adding enzyme)
MSGTRSVDRVIAQASKLVTPTNSEIKKLVKIVLRVTSLLNKTLEKENSDPKPEIILGGSYARGTWLKGNHDIDFFMLYPIDFPRDMLESVAIRCATDAMEGYTVNLRYAEHPYVESFVDGVRVNIVPCYAVARGEWRSSADRSPYHTKYIGSKMDERLRLEARLFKKFVKSAKVYGAEVKIQGFSGYVCEVLILKYGSFMAVLQALSKLRLKEVISLEEFDKDLATAFVSAIVILDPVDTTRNLGTAISARNVGRIVLQSRRFLAAPKLSYFLPSKNSSISQNSKSRLLISRMLIVSFRIEKRSPDILWGQLRRSTTSISDKLTRIGFKVLKSGAASDEVNNSALLFLMADEKLGQIYLREGPEYFREEEVTKYLEKNRSKALATWIGNDGRLESAFERDRQLMRAESALKSILLKSNIDSIGLSEEIKNEIKTAHKIIKGNDLLKNSKMNWLTKEVVELISS